MLSKGRGGFSQNAVSSAPLKMPLQIPVGAFLFQQQDGTCLKNGSTGYISIWGLNLQSYQIHARCILLDTKTGYRSQFLQVSGVVRL